MDFGVVALEGLVSCSDNIHTNNNTIASFFPSPTITTTTTAANSHSLVTTAATSTTTSSNPDPKPKWYGSGLFGKQERSVTSSEDDWRELKMPRTNDDDFSLSKAALSFQNSQRSYSASTTSTSLLRSNTSLHSDGQQMLSFSSPNSQTAPTVAYFPHTSSASYGRNTGYGSSSGFNASSMHGVKGPFTPSQWMELEHQALIYKYITANAPIPSNLLIPIRKALESAAFSTFPGAHIRHNPYGWGAFHMGFSGSSDPEPGRCRRTDGKKWRCSRDAVADQKYCERHMNRGRHRSRKPVEGQTGHSVSGGGPTNTTAKLMPMSSTASPAAVTAGSGASNSTLNHLHNNQLNGMQPGVPNLSASSQLNNRSFLNKGNVSQKNQENQYSILKHHNPSAELSRSEFGFVCSDSLLNPLHEGTSSLLSSRSYGSSKDLSDREAKSQSSLRQFMDDWPHSDRTQLSISIPMAASSDFMSSTSSPSNEKLALSPLRLSRELDPTQMGLGMGARGNEASHRQANWIPISWETSMGGPLGEVLHSTNNSAGESTNASPLNLMTEGWDSSPRMALSSPTGVLQKTAFGSLSNSSAGSSPRTENKLLGSTLMNSTPSAAMIS